MKSAPLVLIAMAGFKGSLTNEEACDAVGQALKVLKIPFKTIPIGDGGRGTKETVQACLGGDWDTLTARGPLGKRLDAKILCYPNRVQPEWLYIESADVCGYHLIPDKEKDALRASSHGLGDLILQGTQRWKNSLKKIYVGLGDSLTSDAGMGMLSALGFSFQDDSGREIWGNANGLRLIHRIVTPPHTNFSHIQFTVLCDVLNPLCGPTGSANVFAPQKGATSGQVKQIEIGMENFATHVIKQQGRNIRLEPMTGSSGGIAAAFSGLMGAQLVHGSRFLLDWVQFDRQMEACGVVITGEGKTDSQTLQGKAPLECIDRAIRLKKNSVLLSGSFGPGWEMIRNKPHLIGCYASGMEPNPSKALFEKTVEIFSQEKLLNQMGQGYYEDGEKTSPGNVSETNL